MTTFDHWTDVVHAFLDAKVRGTRRIKRSRVQEILAAALGHRTYASFRLADRETLDKGRLSYILLDGEAATSRASSVGIPLDAELWHQAEMLLRPSGMSRGAWITDLGGMARAADLVFEDTPSDEIVSIWKRYGDMPNGRRSIRNGGQRKLEGTPPPKTLTFNVNGEQCVMGSPLDTVVPLRAKVTFRLLARRGYGKGELSDVQISGATYLEEAPDLDGLFYGP